MPRPCISYRPKKACSSPNFARCTSPRSASTPASNRFAIGAARVLTLNLPDWSKLTQLRRRNLFGLSGGLCSRCLSFAVFAVKKNGSCKSWIPCLRATWPVQASSRQGTICNGGRSRWILPAGPIKHGLALAANIDLVQNLANVRRCLGQFLSGAARRRILYPALQREHPVFGVKSYVFFVQALCQQGG